MIISLATIAEKQRALDNLSTDYYESIPTKRFIRDVCQFLTKLKSKKKLRSQTIGEYLRGFLMRKATPLPVGNSQLYGLMGSYFGDIVYMYDDDFYIFKV